VIRTILALTALVALSACGQPQQQEEGYPPHYEYGFMRACEAQGPAPGVCACTWDRIEAEVPRSEFDRFERLSARERAADPLTSQFEEFGRTCATSAASIQEVHVAPADETEPEAP